VRCNACLFSWHLLTVRMRPDPVWDGFFRCLRAP
jgi:hypothetical protein